MSWRLTLKWLGAWKSRLLFYRSSLVLRRIATAFNQTRVARASSLLLSPIFFYFSGLFDLVVKYYKAELKFPEEAAKAALCACFYGLQWDLIYIQSTTERDSTVNDVNALKQRLDQYMVAMQEVLANSSGIILEEAYLCICDLLISFSRRVSFR